MLGTGARYAEYGITGGFFLVTLALIFGFVFPDRLVWAATASGFLSSAILDKIPPLAQPAIQSLLVALALLSVFLVGLVLEIIGSVFVVYEAWVFRKFLIMNQWVAKFVEAELPDYAEDYGLFLDQVGQIFRWKQEFWGPVQIFESIFQRPRQVQKRFRRLESALLAKVLTSGAKTEMLAEQISICRMSRSIAAALYLFLFLVFYVFIPLSSEARHFAVLLSVIASFLVCAFFIVTGAYSRFASMLFSLVYASWKAPDRPNGRA
jgi:hypothetical protein